MAFWIVKSEPEEYSFERLREEKRTLWTGIRNFAARNNLRAMKSGEQVLFFHTGKEKAAVGVAKVVGEARPDPTSPKGEDWSAVELSPVKPLAEAVPLAVLKANAKTKTISVVKMGRLSVGAVTPAEWAAVLKLSGTKA
jgi:predicted RNA-binding protein with PUA-like domain